MKRRMYIVILIISILSLFTGCSNKRNNDIATSNITNKPIEIMDPIANKPTNQIKDKNETLDYTQNIFFQDAKDVINAVEATHPIFVVDKVPEFYEEKKQEYLSSITNDIKPYEFVLLTRKYLTSLGDLHTNVTGQQDWYFMDVNCYDDGEKFYLLDDAGQVTKSSIIKIDGIPVQNIFKIVDLYFPSENPTGVDFNHSVWSVYKPILELAGCDVSQDTLRVTIDANGTIVEKHIAFIKKLYYDAYSYTTEIHSELIEDIYYIDLNTCVLNEIKFKEEIEKLKDAINNGISKVIIDVRNNGGGNAEYGRQLLDALGMIAPEYGSTFRLSPLASELRKWNKTSGIVENAINSYVVRNNKINLVVLTNEYTFSAATMLGVYVQDGKLGTLIGRPSINAPSCYSDVVQYETKNSKISINISYLKLNRPDMKADQKTLVPDIITDVGEDSLQRAIDFLDSKANIGKNNNY